MQTFRNDPMRAPKKNPVAMRKCSTLLFGEIRFDEFAQRVAEQVGSDGHRRLQIEQGADSCYGVTKPGRDRHTTLSLVTEPDDFKLEN